MIPISEDTLVNAIDKVNKSVVNIASVRMIQDQLFRVFPVQGVGSGVIIDNKGHILTNYHVIDDADRLKITLTDGRMLNGKVVGTDESTDLAVVKVESAEALPFAQLGNSDGPLVNTKGEIIAINTAKMPYAQGIGFAVPVNTAKSILKELIEKGRVSRPWIGIQSIKVNPQLAQYYGLPNHEGALIAGVEPFSPAEDSGLRRGCIIE